MDDYILTPIVPCSVCGARYVEDPTRDGMGRQLPEEDLFERDWQPHCESCQQQAFGEAFDEDTLDAVGRKLGITEENKGTLEALIYIMDNQDRVMMVAHAQQRVDELERRLEDRTVSLRDLVESKLENANSRLFVSSLITNAALFLSGILVGIVVALLLGG